jgi:polyhydroxyalkanoate synthesis regulator phasin
MANEITVRHNHDDGIFHAGWDFHKDASVEAAAAQLNVDALDGLTVEELEKFIASAMDQGQLTEREARQLSEGLRRNYGRMTPEARQLAEKLDLKLQSMLADVHDSSDGHFRNSNDVVVMQDAQLDTFLADVNSTTGLDGTAQELLNEHTHDAGLLRRDWKFYTDASLDLALQKLEAAGRDGISANELLDFVKAAVDFGQITYREARQLMGALNRLFPQLSPEARQVASRLRDALFEAYPPSRVPANGIFVGNSDILDLQDDDRYRNGTDGTNLNGEKLAALMTDLNNIANPLRSLGNINIGNLIQALGQGDHAQPASPIRRTQTPSAGSWVRG